VMKCTIGDHETVVVALDQGHEAGSALEHALEPLVFTTVHGNGVQHRVTIQ